MSLVIELRRRQVFRAAAWYAAAAWLAIQVASTVLPQFGLPEWPVRALIAAAILGLPIALALAWSFDLSSLGLRRETPATHEVPNQPAVTATAPLWRIPFVVIPRFVATDPLWRLLENDARVQQIIRDAFPKPG